MEKIIDLKSNIYELTNEYPELIEMMKEEGFAAIGNSVVRSTMGRTMTIPSGCKKLGVPLEKVVSILKDRGYTVINIPNE
jgi:uncharacterized protein